MPMSTEHKEALAQGRRESRAIKSYLTALNNRRPGRPVTTDTITKRLATLQDKIATEPDPLKKIDLMQAKLDAETQLADLAEAADLEALEAGFVEAAASYSHRKGITYTAWREAGVPAATLRKAGIGRTRSHR